MNWNSTKNELFLNPRLKSSQIQTIQNWVAAVSQQLKGHVFLFSSGTTAVGKCIALSKKAILVAANSVNQHLCAHPKDRWLNVLPLFHIGGLSIDARSVLSGAQMIHMGQWNPPIFLNTLSEERITLTALVPTQMYDLIRASLHCPPSVRAVLVGGEALSIPVYQEARRLGWPLLPCYGMTETSAQVATAALESFNPDTPPPLKILSHVEIQEDHNGFLQMRSEALFTAYLFLEEGTLRIHDPKIQGWFQTQDRGLCHPPHLTVLGRSENFIKISGESVEINRLEFILEDVKQSVQSPADCALLPIPDPRLGYTLHLISDDTLSESTADRIIHEFNHRVLPFEKIHAWHSMKKLPRTDLGKLQRGALQKKFSIHL